MKVFVNEFVFRFKECNVSSTLVKEEVLVQLTIKTELIFLDDSTYTLQSTGARVSLGIHRSVTFPPSKP